MYTNGQYPPPEPRYVTTSTPGNNTPWAMIIVVIVAIGILTLAYQEARNDHRSSTLDRLDECCRVIGGDTRKGPKNSAGDRER